MDIEGMNAAEIDKLAKDLAAKAIEIRKAEERAARQARLEKAATEQKAHAVRLFEEIGRPLAGLNAKQHGEVYAMAWEQGHASGYSEVEMHYGDFAELARKIIESN